MNSLWGAIVINDEDCLDQYGVENESIGALLCHKMLGGVWIQTSFNAKFRKNFAGIGYFYDKTRDAFIPPKIFDSWILDAETCDWVAPIPMPIDGYWRWDEQSQSWIEVELDNNIDLEA